MPADGRGKDEESIAFMLSQVAVGSFESVRHTLDSLGVDVRSARGGGYTALHAAAEAGHEDIVRALILLGADVNCTSASMDTPLMHAATEGHVGVASQLIEAHALIGACSTCGEDALMQAAAGGHISVVLLLLHHKAPTRSRCERGRTALSYAISSRSYGCVRALLAASAPHNLKTTLISSTPPHDWITELEPGPATPFELLEMLLVMASSSARAWVFAFIALRHPSLQLSALPTPHRLAVLWLVRAAGQPPPDLWRADCGADVQAAVWNHSWTHRTIKYFPPGLRMAVRAMECLAARTSAPANAFQALPSALMAIVIEHVVDVWLGGVLEVCYSNNVNVAPGDRCVRVYPHSADRCGIHTTLPHTERGTLAAEDAIANANGVKVAFIPGPGALLGAGRAGRCPAGDVAWSVFS